MIYNAFCMQIGCKYYRGTNTNYFESGFCARKGYTIYIKEIPQYCYNIRKIKTWIVREKLKHGEAVNEFKTYSDQIYALNLRRHKREKRERDSEYLEVWTSIDPISGYTLINWDGKEDDDDT